MYGDGLETHLLYSNYGRWGNQPNNLDHLKKVGANNRIRKDVGRYYRGPCECESGTL